VAVFFDLVVYVEKDIFGGGFPAEVIGGAIVKHKKPERVVVQASDPFDKGGRATRINIEILFFYCKAFTQAPFFLLVLGEKVQVKAKAETLGEVGVRDDGILVLHINPGIIIPSQEGILFIVVELVHQGGRQADDVGSQPNIIAVLFFKHPGRDIVGVGEIAGGGKDEGIAGTGVDAVIAARVGSVDFGAGLVEDGHIGKNFGRQLAFDPAIQAGSCRGLWLLNGGGSCLLSGGRHR
jgi:hypothetical protein